MNLTSYSEIKATVKNNWQELGEAAYPEDLLNEWADSEVPVYYSTIVPEWLDLPMSETDAWQDMGLDSNATILDRMRVDLLIHYEREFAEAYRELLEEEASAE